jgi:hypothetical protein
MARPQAPYRPISCVLGWYILRELGDEAQRIEHLHILFVILRICGVKKNPRLELLVPEFLQSKRRPSHVFSEILPRSIAEKPDAVIDAEAGMHPKLKIFREILPLPKIAAILDFCWDQTRQEVHGNYEPHSRSRP